MQGAARIRLAQLLKLALDLLQALSECVGLGLQGRQVLHVAAVAGVEELQGVHFAELRHVVHVYEAALHLLVGE